MKSDDDDDVPLQRDVHNAAPLVVAADSSPARWTKATATPMSEYCIKVMAAAFLLLPDGTRGCVLLLLLLLGRTVVGLIFSVWVLVVIDEIIEIMDRNL
jgi:hypothetical protein